MSLRGVAGRVRTWIAGARAGGWSFVAVCTLFTAMGLWMALAGGRDRRAGIGVAAFFGLCLATGVWVLRVRRAHRRSAEARHVEIVGSVPIHVRAGRGAALLVLVAVVLAIVGWAFQGFAAWLALAVAGLCTVLVPVALFGPPSRRALVFEPEGLRFLEPSWQVLVPWDGIAAARLVDVHDTLVAAFILREPAEALAQPLRARGDPQAARRRVARAVRLNRALYGCDLATAPAAFGLDAVLFLRAVETYVADREARAGLAPRPALEA